MRSLAKKMEKEREKNVGQDVYLAVVSQEAISILSSGRDGPAGRCKARERILTPAVIAFLPLPRLLSFRPSHDEAQLSYILSCTTFTRQHF